MEGGEAEDEDDDESDDRDDAAPVEAVEDEEVLPLVRQGPERLLMSWVHVSRDVLPRRRIRTIRRASAH